MPDLVIKRVASRRERRQFLEFPWRLYWDDPNWIPPLRSTQKELVGYRPHPFYERNLVQTFLACRGGEVCGRIAAILNLGHIDRYRERRGYFGFFECVDDQQVANGLFDAVRQWFAAQEIHCLRGPANPSANYEWGLLVDGFDSPSTFMLTYNPPYYARLLEGYGFRKAQDMFAFWGHIDMLPKIQERLGPVVEQMIAYHGLRLRTMDTKRFRQDVEAFLTVFNRSMTNTWGFVPMSASEVAHSADSLRHLLVPELAVAAEIDGKMVGVALGILDFNPRIKQIDGRLFPFGFVRLLRNKLEIKRLRLVSTNVLPEYQLQGIGLALLHGMVPMALKTGLQEAEFSWVLESNSLSYGSLKKGGTEITKTWRIYDLDPPPPAPPSVITAAWRTPSAQGPLEIRAVQNRADLDQFCRVPWRIYADDPQWVPPLLVEVKEFLNPRKHPFYLHGAAATYLATRGGVPLGRILVSDDPRYNEKHGTNVGCFGMFECGNDEEMAGGLLEAAATWLRARGRTAIMGPIDYSTNYPCGLLVEGFETPPRIMMNHNRPYYARLLESWGLGKSKDLYSWWFVDPQDMLVKWRERAERLGRRGGVTVRPLRKRDFEVEISRCQVVYGEAMRDNWGAVKLSDAEFRYMAERLARVADPNLVLLAEVDGRPVGIAVTLPDVNEAIRPLGGRLTRCGLPINLARLAWRMRRIKTARMVILNVIDKYRRRGVAEMLILRTLDYGKNTVGFTGAELSWTLEDNDSVNRMIEAVGARHYKTHRIYGKTL